MRNMAFPGALDDQDSASSKSETDERSFVLKPSSIRGVGVFATHPISMGGRLNMFEDGDIRNIAYSAPEAQREKEFCQWFCVEDKNGYWCPKSFSRMSIGWYLNHSERPNAAVDEDDEFWALRDIGAGEEITIDYRHL